MGPIDAKGFEQLIRDVVVSGPTLVWSSGMAEWQPWAQVVDSTAVCAASGGRYWQRDMVPYEGKFISAEFKEQYFQRLREGITLPGGMTYAAFWPRAAAKIIDFIVYYAISFAVSFGGSLIIFGSIMPNPQQSVDNLGKILAFQGVIFLINMSILLAYQWFFLSRYSATPGKMALGLKIVRADGSALSTGRIFGRYFAEMLSGMILWIGYFMAGFDEQKRSLHDRICDTRVIKAK